jgi:hypothetical protein
MNTKFRIIILKVDTPSAVALSNNFKISVESSFSQIKNSISSPTTWTETT